MKPLSWSEKLSFGAGAFGKDLVYGLVATYIFVYFTDVCYLAPQTVGVIFLLSRIFDAVNDPLMGLIVDNTRSRFGKFKPWLLIGTVVNAIVLVLLFSKFNLSPGGMIAYAALLYILWGVTYTIMDIPYWSMIPDLGSTPQERNQIAAIPRIFASSAWLVVGGFTLPAVALLGGADVSLGYFRVSLMIAVLFVLCVGLTLWHVPVRDVAAEHHRAVHKTSVREMIHVLIRNDQVICVLFISTLFNLMIQFNGGVAIYFLKNVAEVPKLIPAFLFYGSLAQIGGIFCYPLLAKVMKRSRILFFSSFTVTASCCMILALRTFTPATTAITAVLFGFGGGLMLPILTVLLADAVDYGEAKLGTRNESIIFSTQTFVVKLASALSGFIIGLGLSAAHYMPEAALSVRGKWILTLMMAVMPLLMMAGYLVIYWKFYRPWQPGIDANEKK